jgi:hypothetical protein
MLHVNRHLRLANSHALHKKLALPPPQQTSVHSGASLEILRQICLALHISEILNPLENARSWLVATQPHFHHCQAKSALRCCNCENSTHPLLPTRATAATIPQIRMFVDPLLVLYLNTAVFTAACTRSHRTRCAYTLLSFLMMISCSSASLLA